MDETRTDVDTKLKEAIEQAKTIVDAAKLAAEATSSDRPKHSDSPTKYYKNYADNFTIDGNEYQIRVKKFQDDETPLQCDDSGEFLTTYASLCQIAAPYGVLISDIKTIETWDRAFYEEPPTCPYESDDFTSRQNYAKAYSLMSLAIATKLRTYVKFGPDYLAAKLAVNRYNNDGYRMLYELLLTSHPKLQRNKAVKPGKPTFEGDMAKYIHRFRNWLEYQKSRKNPHLYDDDEIADEVLLGIKLSVFGDVLKKGISEVEQKLDTWKNGDSASFPELLRLDNIGRSIMLYYIERNEDPLQQMQQRHNHHRQNRDVAARAAYYNNNNNRGRQRYRTPPRNSGDQNNRSNSPGGYSQSSYGNNNYRRRSATPTRGSSNERLRQCTFCQGLHRESTIGCPHFLQHYHLNEHMTSMNASDLRQQVTDMERRRSRSNSRSSQNNSRERTHNRDRSNSR